MIKKIIPIIIVISLSIFAVLPLIQNGFFPMHDDTQPSRVYEMAKSLKSGMFPVRWVDDLGYGSGYPIFNFYAPLPYYFGAFFVLAGIGPVSAAKIMIGTGMLLAAVTMYLLISSLWKSRAGILSALFYMYAPYHAVNIYVRGAVGELWAYGLIPLFFYGLINLYKHSNLKFFLISTLSFGAIILSHNLSAFMLLIFLLLYLAIFVYVSLSHKKNFSLLLIIFSIITGTFISAFYWIPAILEIQNTNVSSILIGGSDFRLNFVCVNQLWESTWGFGGSIPGCFDGMSFRIGKIHLIYSSIASILILFTLLKISKQKSINNLLGLFFVIGFILSIFLMLNYSLFLWENIKLFSYLQYPWRFMVFTAFYSSILSGFLISQIERFKSMTITVVIIIMSISFLFYSNLKLFTPQIIQRVDDSYYISSEALKWRISKISDEYLPKKLY